MFDALKDANTDVELYIISVLPTTPAFYTNSQERIVELNEALKNLADNTKNVTFVDCHSAFVGADGYCKDGLTFDGLHPNLDGYAVIAESLKSYLTDEDEPGKDKPRTGNEYLIVVLIFVVIILLVVMAVCIRKRKRI